MISGKPPYFSPNKDEMLNNIECNKISFQGNISKNVNGQVNHYIENPMKKLGVSLRDPDEIKDYPFFLSKLIGMIYYNTQQYLKLLKQNYQRYQPIINQEIFNQKFASLLTLYYQLKSLDLLIKLMDDYLLISIFSQL
ncbi:unnamed protein product [Paramecium octaurelia]|uniref:Uncharacterized protein n=1 Tax=Paramecium octaurelia TaxID=43137 RepID=A0A8S1YLL7_PAROT|nr:unnamed protein product [Paramecium octaurelia]